MRGERKPLWAILPGVLVVSGLLILTIPKLPGFIEDFSLTARVWIAVATAIALVIGYGFVVMYLGRLCARVKSVRGGGSLWLVRTDKAATASLMSLGVEPPWVANRQDERGIDGHYVVLAADAHGVELWDGGAAEPFAKFKWSRLNRLEPGESRGSLILGVAGAKAPLKLKLVEPWLLPASRGSARQVDSQLRALRTGKS